MEDIRSFNVGASDYSKHKYQSWDFWIVWALNPFDADLSKRILRTKATDGRLLDYQKIKHICGERIRQLTEASDTWDLPNMCIPMVTFEKMIADYNLCDEDIELMTHLLFPNIHPILTISNAFWRKARIKDYKAMQDICDKRINALQGE